MLLLNKRAAPFRSWCTRSGNFFEVFFACLDYVALELPHFAMCIFLTLNFAVLLQFNTV